MHNLLVELSIEIDELNEFSKKISPLQRISDPGTILTELGLRIIKLKNDLDDHISVQYSKARLVNIGIDLENLIYKLKLDDENFIKEFGEDAVLSNNNSNNDPSNNNISSNGLSEETVQSYKNFINTLLQQLSDSVNNKDTIEVMECISVVNDVEKMFETMKTQQLSEREERVKRLKTFRRQSYSQQQYQQQQQPQQQRQQQQQQQKSHKDPSQVKQSNNDEFNEKQEKIRLQKQKLEQERLNFLKEKEEYEKQQLRLQKEIEEYEKQQKELELEKLKINQDKILLQNQKQSQLEQKINIQHSTTINTNNNNDEIMESVENIQDYNNNDNVSISSEYEDGDDDEMVYYMENGKPKKAQNKNNENKYSSSNKLETSNNDNNNSEAHRRKSSSTNNNSIVSRSESSNSLSSSLLSPSLNKFGPMHSTQNILDQELNELTLKKIRTNTSLNENRIAQRRHKRRTNGRLSLSADSSLQKSTISESLPFLMTAFEEAKAAEEDIIEAMTPSLKRSASRSSRSHSSKMSSIHQSHFNHINHDLSRSSFESISSYRDVPTAQTSEEGFDLIDEIDETGEDGVYKPDIYNPRDLNNDYEENGNYVDSDQDDKSYDSSAELDDDIDDEAPPINALVNKNKHTAVRKSTSYDNVHNNNNNANKSGSGSNVPSYLLSSVPPKTSDLPPPLAPSFYGTNGFLRAMFQPKVIHINTSSVGNGKDDSNKHLKHIELDDSQKKLIDDDELKLSPKKLLKIKVGEGRVKETVKDIEQQLHTKKSPPPSPSPYTTVTQYNASHSAPSSPPRNRPQINNTTNSSDTNANVLKTLKNGTSGSTNNNSASFMSPLVSTVPSHLNRTNNFIPLIGKTPRDKAFNAASANNIDYSFADIDNLID
ncbi:unnamed protein product [[Candida] boidinii]|nr:unnamed protein product [[Candida] boidinii]